VKDTSTETGHIFVRRDEKMRIEIAKPDLRTILRTGDSLFVYNPKINRGGRIRPRQEPFDGRSIRSSWLWNKESTISGKVIWFRWLAKKSLDHKKTVVLELTPKSDQIRNQIIKIQMWIDEASWLPIQQKFFEAGSGRLLFVSLHQRHEKPENRRWKI